MQVGETLLDEARDQPEQEQEHATSDVGWWFPSDSPLTVARDNSNPRVTDF